MKFTLLMSTHTFMWTLSWIRWYQHTNTLLTWSCENFKLYIRYFYWLVVLWVILHLAYGLIYLQSIAPSVDCKYICKRCLDLVNGSLQFMLHQIPRLMSIENLLVCNPEMFTYNRLLRKQTGMLHTILWWPTRIIPVELFL